ncbi:hypothetical protein NT6N_30660 [Oceaniferula spumae]|uniref:Uncharacterized protein n=1 Tax=Oceaniferula spumae TaxID=2979115 RepID=A0AAT9FQ63_9BACT
MQLRNNRDKNYFIQSFRSLYVTNLQNIEKSVIKRPLALKKQRLLIVVSLLNQFKVFHQQAKNIRFHTSIRLALAAAGQPFS